MAPKKSQANAAPVVTTGTTTTTVPAVSTPAKKPSSDAWSNVASNILSHYQKTTPQRTKLIDLFMAFLVLVGGLQFVYCVVAGNYPFNAFLSGFSATVGQFVLTASLRIQTTEANKADFPSVSPERAFADYVVGSLILHFFCVNFIN
ncbi:Dolichyl-diphosphooligosaccharide--protein glycosyltransferase subunit dad1 [Apiospora marii]|uniref:Dolichyl-diphosphooligosaccharide--protein glycosyltransferase subunit OST2 n=1 Tax=Apiospora marii TaxID=335849 RepID=A0ABR1SFK5_9PEZI